MKMNIVPKSEPAAIVNEESAAEIEPVIDHDSR